MRAEVREDVRARLQDWRIYLEIMKQVAQTRQICKLSAGAVIGPGETGGM